MINYGRHFIDREDTKSVRSTLRSNFLTQGPKTIQFEDKLKYFCGAKYASAVSSGTAALHLALLALDVKKNDLVITTPITFLASPNVALYVNAKPIFVDINKNNYCIDINKLEKKIINLKEKKKKIKAVIITDYAGHVCDWEKIKILSKKYNFFTINDNCHALGAKYKKNIKYACRYADIVTQSFHPVKIITTGEGGAILTNNKKFYERFKILRTHGVLKNNNLIKKYGQWYYEMVALGYNYRLSDIHASLGISQLKKIKKFLKKRKQLAKKYDSSFTNKFFFKSPFVEKYCEHSYHIYPLQINFDKLKINKKQFFLKLKKSNINLQVHYIPIHLQKFYKQKFNYKLGDFPVAEEYYKKTVSLPLFHDLSIKKQNKVIKSINALCLKYKKIKF